MDIAAVMALILKGVSVIESLVTVGQDIAPAIKVVRDVVTGAQTGTITQADLLSAEDTLDRLIADFNADI
jgi:hypothetical protein